MRTYSDSKRQNTQINKLSYLNDLSPSPYKNFMKYWIPPIFHLEQSESFF